MINFLKASALIMAIHLAVSARGAETNYFTDWPSNSSPQEIGKRVAEEFLSRPIPPGQVHYKEVCAWYGALEFAHATADSDLESRLSARIEPLLANSSRLPSRPHVDDHVFGAVPFEIFFLNQDPRCLALGRRYADEQWLKTTPDGISTEARYWVDDMFMMTINQLQAYRATKDPKYLDRMAKTMVAYLDRLQQSNGLFLHATNAPFYWSRGNGWFAAGMTEMLRTLPRDNPNHARILKGYQSMLASLLQFQGEDGLWRQLIDHPDFWPETSGTAMFAYAMVTGVKNGWLDSATFGPAARKAWLGLTASLASDYQLRNVCEGTGARNDLNYYLTRQRLTGDLHGQAPLLWTATALLR